MKARAGVGPIAYAASLVAAVRAEYKRPMSDEECLRRVAEVACVGIEESIARTRALVAACEIVDGTKATQLTDYQAVCYGLCLIENDLKTALCNEKLASENARLDLANERAALNETRAELSARTSELRAIARSEIEDRIRARIDEARNAERAVVAMEIAAQHDEIDRLRREVAELRATKKKLREALERERNGQGIRK